MKKYFLFIQILLLAFINSHASKQTLEVEKVKCNFEKDNGMLDGEYISYYPSGQIKSKGKFSKNNRIGHWVVYDTKGNVAVDREYSSSLQFIQNLPSHQNSLHNANNQYDILSAESIWIRKRFFKQIDKNENQEIFSNTDFLSYVANVCNQKQTKLYEDDRFVNEKVKEGNPSLKNIAIVSFKIKEEAIIDLRRFVLDYRVIGINPIVKTSNGEIKELGWLYFPDLLDNIKNENKPSLNEAISVVLSRQYSSQSYKAITMSSLTNSEEQYSIPEKYTNDYQDISLIEKEHDVWIQFLLAKSED